MTRHSPVCLAPVLYPVAEMVATLDSLLARPQLWVTIVPSQLGRFVHCRWCKRHTGRPVDVALALTLAIPQVGCLRVSGVLSETFRAEADRPTYALERRRSRVVCENSQEVVS